MQDWLKVVSSCCLWSWLCDFVALVKASDTILTMSHSRVSDWVLLFCYSLSPRRVSETVTLWILLLFLISVKHFLLCMVSEMSVIKCVHCAVIFIKKKTTKNTPLLPALLRQLKTVLGCLTLCQHRVSAKLNRKCYMSLWHLANQCTHTIGRHYHNISLWYFILFT